jgi:hypothetical protein
MFDLPKKLLEKVFRNGSRDELLDKFVQIKNLILVKRKLILAVVIDVSLLAFIFATFPKPAQRLISALVSPWQSAYIHSQIQSTEETFSFAPGQAPNKFKYIDLNGLGYLSFYDLPLTNEGINFDSRGYNAFIETRTTDLIEKTKSYGVKFLVTISQTEDSTIRLILDDKELQQKIIDQTIEEVKNAGIDGVTVDFEMRNSAGYSNKFSHFVANLKTQMHAQVPNSVVTVVVPSTAAADKNGFYDLSAIDKSADRVLVMMADNIVAEESNNTLINPVYGYGEEDYFGKLSENISGFTDSVSRDKLVMERAWYGNGDRYPLYVPTNKPVSEPQVEPAHVLLDSEMVDRLAVGVPQEGRAAARKNIPLIGKALEREGILDSNVLAYALATIEHETASTFEPIEEIQGRQSARRYGYEGGSNYFGRGFIQLTHLRNYRMVGERIGMGDQLVKHPELASDPDVAAKILAAFFKDNNVANLASKGYFVAARTPINPDYNGYSIAMLATKYE